MRLKNGGIVRGTIAELVPGDKVVIVSLTGETKTYPMSDVQYAGSASAEVPAPSAPAPAPASSAAPATPATRGSDEARSFITLHSDEARVHFDGSPEGLTFHVRTGSATASGGGHVVTADAYSEICTAPCDASLPAGTHTLALSHDGGSPVAVDPIRVAGTSTLYGTYKDRSGIRIGGWVIFLGGTIAGGALMVSSIGDTDSRGSLYGGIALMGVGAVVGGLMALISDGAEIEQRRAD